MKQIVLCTSLLCIATATQAGILWYGNDDAGTDFHSTTAGVILGTINEKLTGVAWDRSVLYTSTSLTSDIQRRILDGILIDTSNVPAATATENIVLDGEFAVPTNNPTGALTPLGALGVAYDSRRDLFGISLCEAGCTNLHAGIVMAFDAGSLTPIGTLFTDSVFLFGSLAYDAATDSP